MKNYWKLLVTILVAEGAGMIGAIFTTPNISSWYDTLPKPFLAPPNWIFAPVWTILFLLMGISAYIIWQKGLKDKKVKIALGVFVLQLVLNTLWSFIFFGQHNPGLAFAEIIILWLAILATIILFAKISRPAFWLLIPYILWVIFAGYLNYSFWQLSNSNANVITSTINFTSANGTIFNKFSVEKILDEQCTVNPDCVLPSEFAIQSRCQFASVCLANRCVVICPVTK